MRKGDDSLSKNILENVKQTQKFLIQLFSKSWSGPGLKALVAVRRRRNLLMLRFFQG